MSVIFSEADKYFNPDTLDEKAKVVLEASKLANDANYKVDPSLEKILSGEQKAKYKIEVIFPPKRKINEAIPCAVTAFKSGGNIHGGGDELLYLCRHETDATLGCGAVLKGNPMVGDMNGEMVTVYFCDNCKKYVNRQLLSSTLLYKLPLKTLANNIYKLFRQLDSNADIYLKHIRVDIRNASLSAKTMNKVPEKMEYAIYTLKNILRDTSNESQVVNRIEAFLKA